MGASVGLLFGFSALLGPLYSFPTPKYGPVTGLGQSDWTMLEKAAEHLNKARRVHVGDRQDWSNPESGNSGLLTVTRSFYNSGQPCHSVRYDLLFTAPRPRETYTIDWCRTASGEWKMKSPE